MEVQLSGSDEGYIVSNLTSKICAFFANFDTLNPPSVLIQTQYIYST